MATLKQQIDERFLAKLADSDHVDAEMIGHLRRLLAGSKKLKVDDVLRVFAPPAGGDTK